MNKTDIEYLDYTWNPIAMRCTPVSEGCKNCWHLRMCKRHAANPKLGAEMRKAKSGASVMLRILELLEPVGKRKPARIGVQFMGDLFHEIVPDDFLLRVFNQMRACCYVPGHTFLVLTKRPERMRDFCLRLRFDGLDGDDGRIWLAETHDGPGYRPMGGGGCNGLQNIWLGVSVENQKAADERIPILLQTPAAVRWVSVEPMLEAIDLQCIKDADDPKPGESTVSGWYIDALNRTALDDENGDLRGEYRDVFGGMGIDWVVCGAESGSGSRTCRLEWVRSLKNQCVEAGVPFFYKQGPEGKLPCEGTLLLDDFAAPKEFASMPVLDGRRWAQMPETKI